MYLTSKFRISYQIFEAECSPKWCCWRKVLGAGRLPWALGAGLALVAAKPWGRTRKGLLELLGCSVVFCCFVVLQDELGYGKALSAVVSLPLLLPLCHFTGDIALQNCQFGPSVTPTVIISLRVIEDWSIWNLGLRPKGSSIEATICLAVSFWVWFVCGVSATKTFKVCYAALL